MKDTLYNIFSVIGEVTLIAFIVLGLALIIGQGIGVLCSPELVLKANSTLKQPAMTLACISGFASLFCIYTKPKKKK